MTNKPILITTGEPAGIGMDIVLDLACQGYLKSLSRPIIVTGCEQSFHERASQLSLIRNHKHKHNYNHKLNYNHKATWQPIHSIDDIDDEPDTNSNKNIANDIGTDFYLLNTPTAAKVTAGIINTSNATMVLQQLAMAHDLAINEKVAGIVTAPLQKSALIDANLTLPDGTIFSGHTEYFMLMSNRTKVVMMLANSRLKVALVTTHLPLSQVANAITKDQVRQTVMIVLNSLQNQFSIHNPKILVCGLNPHAGEGGHLGMEEIEIINPVLQDFIDKGHDVSLSMPADTLFTDKYLADCDATIAMYHDQGLPVLKSHGFGDSVNITLGLPYIRTSVDHGTALDLAGTGKASSDSLRQAIQMLVEMSTEK